MSPAGLGTKNNCAGEGQQQFSSQSVCAVMCVCGGEGHSVSECPRESLPTRGGVTLTVVEHLIRSKSLENKNVAMGPDGTRNQELLCWRGPAI
jgi:hypothetical protein